MTLDVFKNYHATWIHARIISSKLRANISPCLVEWRKNSLSRATLRVYWAHTNLVAIFSANVVLAKFKESCLHLKRSWFSPCRLFKVDAGSSPCIHSTTLTSSLPDYSGELLCQVTCVEPLIFFQVALLLSWIYLAIENWCFRVDGFGCWAQNERKRAWAYQIGGLMFNVIFVPPW